MTSQLQTVSKPPTKTWDDYYKECLERFGGNRGDPKESEAFREGVLVVFVLLHAEFPTLVRCKAADVLLAACKAANHYLAKEAALGKALTVDEWSCVQQALADASRKAEGGTP